MEEWLRAFDLTWSRRFPGKNDKARLWIMTHLDVVPEGERSLWNTDPWKVVVKGGSLIGRGVEDNQQGLVSSVFAALAFIKQGIAPARTIKLLFVADEEVGSKFGIQHLIANHSLFSKDDLIIIPDGGNAEGSEIEVAEKNICWLKVKTKGVQTHAAMPDKGVNAFLAASDLAVRIHGLEKSVFTARDGLFEPDRTTINPTKKGSQCPEREHDTRRRCLLRRYENFAPVPRGKSHGRSKEGRRCRGIGIWGECQLRSLAEQ